MKRKRRDERAALMADVTIQPGEHHRARFAGTVFNISRSGLAIFSQYYFPPGLLVGLELVLPVPGEGLRRIILYGVTRWVQVQLDGNVLGAELLADAKAGDYEWFDEHFDLYVRQHDSARHLPRFRKLREQLQGRALGGTA